MDGKRVTVIGIIALIIGLLVGYLWWGNRATQTASELLGLRTRLAQAEKAATTQEEALGAKLRGLEAKLKEVTDALNRERAARAQLEASVSKGKK
jgi:hypothetical protein